MQRRAAAIYVVLFVLLGSGSYALITTAESPSVAFEDPAYELAAQDQFQIGTQLYNVSSIETSEEGGGHGGTATATTKAEFQYTNQSAVYTAVLEDNSTHRVTGEQQRVFIQQEEGNPVAVQLQDELNESAILAADPSASEELVMQNNTRYVVRNQSELISASDYFPQPQTQTISMGEAFTYQNNSTTIHSITNESVELRWTATRTNIVDVSNHENVTLSGETYLVHFPDTSTVQLTQQFDEYHAQTNTIAQFKTQKNGLWGISIASMLTVIFLIGFAYLPSRY